MATTPTPPASAGSIWDYYGAPPPPQPSVGYEPGDFNDPFNQYLATIPLAMRQAQTAIGGGIASLGRGARHGTAGMNIAGQIMGQTAQGMNRDLLQTLYAHSQGDLDRKLQASMGLLSASPQVEEALQNRLGMRMDVWGDQAKAAQRAAAQRMAYERARLSEFERNKYGTLPMLMGALSNGTGGGMEPITSTSGGQRGLIDYALDFGNLNALWSRS